LEKQEATYHAEPKKNGRGMFYFTDCCNNKMFSIFQNPLKYHGCLCPKCYYHNKITVLYLQGTEEAGRISTKEQGEKMLEWKKLDAGDYETKDQRFHAIKAYDRIYGNHWELHDRNEPDFYKGKYDEHSLSDCKLRAETILKEEQVNA
jgi:hypothetical protein